MRALVSEAARLARHIGFATHANEVWRELNTFAATYGFERMRVWRRPAGASEPSNSALLFAHPAVQPADAQDDHGLASGFTGEMPFALSAASTAHQADGNGWIIPLSSEESRGVLILSGAKPDMSPLVCSVLHLLALFALCKADERPAASPPPKTGLTARETECLRLVARGKTDREIAQILSVSPRTARFHVENVKTKLSVDTRVQAVAEAIRRQLIAA
jgi:DNA-binding CsgD family transcriptional regulator